MKTNSNVFFSGLMAVSLMGTVLTPLAANAQRSRDDSRYDQSDRDRRDRADQQRRDDAYYRNHPDEQRQYSSNRDRRSRDNGNYRDDNNYRDSNNYRGNEYDRRQQTKNEWRNIAIGAGAVGVLGLLKHDNFLTFAGGAGALYSVSRYEADRRSQNRADRLRSEYFSRPYFYRDGTRYERRTVDRDGRSYYQFYRR